MKDIKKKPEEKNYFIYKLLNFPIMYLAVQLLLYKKGSRYKIFNEHFNLKKNDSILEIGCGPGINRKYLDSDSYIGVDINCSHINNALKKYPNENFVCKNVLDFDENGFAESKNILICHLLHHLNDENCKSLIRTIHKNINKDQNIFLIDIIFTDNQNPIAKMLGKLDKGNYVRHIDQYVELFDENLFHKEVKNESKLLRFPSNFAITKLSKK